MSDAVNIRSFHVVVDAPAEVVFDFIEDLRNLPRWSIHFCRSIRVIPGDGAIVASPSGEVYFGTTGDRDSGVLDWWSGPTMETAQRWPTRVVGLPDGRTLYQVTAILGPDAPIAEVERMFADELGTLKRLVEQQGVAA
jgi:uncharacterized membrane protein